MNSELLQGFYLDDLLVEPLKGQVTGRTGSKHLPPKAVEVLLRLAQHPHQLVTRDTLLDEVWGEGQGSNEALGHAISEIRHALDDHADDPHFIQTLPKRGYRLVVGVVPAEEFTASVIIGAQNGASASDIGLIENLKRRGVFETVLAYLVIGWLLIQVADIVFGQLHLPAWAGTFVTVLVIAGFPIAIVLSWFLEFRDGRAIVHKLSPADARRKRFSRTYTSVVGALATAAVLVFAYDRFIGLPEPEPPPPLPEAELIAIAENSIAVLPFMNVDGSGETQIFANGFVDDVINRLARVPGLLVSSRGDSFTMDPNSASDHVRQRLEVAMYLEGSVQIAGNQIRIIVQLIDSATGFHIISRTFDRPREDFFAIRDEVTELTVSSLRVTLPEDTQLMTTANMQNPSLDAYLLYRRGMEEYYKPSSEQTLADALDWFDAAIEVDSEYAAAFAGKCGVHVEQYDLGEDPAVVPLAETWCAEALALNPNLDVVHAALGDLYVATGRHADAVASFEQAIGINEKNVSALTGLANVLRILKRSAEAEVLLRSAIEYQPGNWQTQNALGFFLFRQGRYAEAAAQFAHVVQIDDSNALAIGNMAASYMLAGDFESAAPAYARAIEVEAREETYNNLGLMYYYLGRYDEAAESLLAAIELSPNAHLPPSNLGDIYTAAGEHELARESFRNAARLAEQALSVNPNDPSLLMDVAWIHAMLGDRERAMDEIGRAMESASDDPYAHYYYGLILHRYGDDDAALEQLAAAADKGYPRSILKAEPHLAGLRDDPRFEGITTD